METARVPGMALAVLQRGEPLAVRTYGVASLEHGDPVTEHSVFELASLTKQITAVALLALEEEGRLDFEARLSDFVPETPEVWKEIRVGQLLSHMAGLAHRFEEKPNGSLLLDYSTAEMLAAARATPMVSEPGDNWHYSDQGYFLAGYVLEQVTGRSFGEHLKERYFRPLGMDRTRILDQSTVIPGRVDGYTVENGVLVNDRRVWQFGLASHFGVLSTIEDIAKWEKALWESRQDDSVLPEAATARSWQVVRSFGGDPERCSAFGYGSGWFVQTVDGVTYAHHGGFTGNFYLRSPDTGLAVIVLTNRQYDAGSPPSDLAWAVAALVDPTTDGIEGACWR